MDRGISSSAAAPRITAAVLGGWGAGIAAAAGILWLPLSLAWTAGAVCAAYLAGYVGASWSVGRVVPPRGTPFRPAASGAIELALPDLPSERFFRSAMIGMTATLNAAILSLAPALGPVAAPWAFGVVLLAAIGGVSRRRGYQRVLGWSSWLLPMSQIATGVGLLLFAINAPIVLSLHGRGGFRLDWGTGAVESAGGLPGMTGFSGGFSLGNFNFVTARALQTDFDAPGLSSHETGHTLNTAALGGVVLWINAMDEGWPMQRWNRAYAELLAESHAQGQGSVGVEEMRPRLGLYVRFWG